MEFIAIIPARGGSKGIKNKNLQLFHNHSLLAHTIEVAQKSNIFNRIMVNSDSPSMIEEAQRYDAEVLFQRPANLSMDSTSTQAVIAHHLNWLKNHESYIPDAFAVLEVTAPLRTSNDLKNAFDLFSEKKSNCLISVAEPLQHPSSCIYEKNNTWEYCFKPDLDSYQRQQFPKTWLINGAIYFTKTEYFLKTQQLYRLADTLIYKMPAKTGVDINTHLDLEIARFLADYSE